MCKLIISNWWKENSMRETFLKLNIALNDELVCRGVNVFVSFHIIWVAKKNECNTLWIYFFPLLKGNAGPCLSSKDTKVGDLQFVTAPNLERSLILDISGRGSILYVVGTVKFLSPKILRK
jgi:hypothetical protein